MEDLESRDYPTILSDVELLHFVRVNDIDWRQVRYLKELSGLTYEVLSDWLDVNVKTLRSYKKKGSAQMKASIKEQLMLLITLFQHGADVFGDMLAFRTWLEQTNFYLDNQKPSVFLKTVTGVRFIKDRITALEYGDNV